MANQSAAPLRALSPSQFNALDEAFSRISDAQQAFAGLMSLLAEANHAVEAQQLYALLAPIEQEFQTARDCLRVVS